jgi:hypothetical protein
LLPWSRYSFTYRFTVIIGTPNVFTISLGFTVLPAIIWLVNMRKLRTSASSRWNTGRWPWMYQTVLPSFRAAILLLISVTPAGNIGGCSCGILLSYPLCHPLRIYISGSFCFHRPAQFTGRDQEV